MREELLGYLLRALEPEEQTRVEEALERDPRLRAELECWDDRLTPLRGLRTDHEPPPGLSARTLDRIFAPPVGAGEVRPASRAYEMAPAVAPRGFTLADVLVIAGVCVAVGVLFLPALSNSRYQSELLACQNNLRELGVALSGYADRHDGDFPAIPERGPLAVAGVYAPTLVEEELVTNPNLFVCAGGPRGAERDAFELPTLAQVRAADGAALPVLQARLGGDYAYNLGHAEHGRLSPPRNEGRTHYAILGDAPAAPLDGLTASHAGRAVNVLFDDFHVGTVTSPLPPSLDDQFYVNRAGRVEAGLDANDAVLGRSASPPFLPVSLKP